MGFRFDKGVVNHLRKRIQANFPDFKIIEIAVNASETEVRIVVRESSDSNAPFIQNKLEWVEGLDCVISSRLWTNVRNRGLGQALMRVKVDFCEIWGIPLLCNVNVANLAQQHILKKFNWQRLTATLWEYRWEYGNMRVPEEE